MVKNNRYFSDQLYGDVLVNYNHTWGDWALTATAGSSFTNTKGAPIPMGDGSYLKDNAGNTVMTALNEQMCKELAQAGKGQYIFNHLKSNIMTTRSANLRCASTRGKAKRQWLLQKKRVVFSVRRIRRRV